MRCTSCDAQAHKLFYAGPDQLCELCLEELRELSRDREAKALLVPRIPIRWIG